jgi:DNA relaxase NicK
MNKGDRERGNNGNEMKKKVSLTFFAGVERLKKAVGPTKFFLSSKILSPISLFSKSCLSNR